MYKEYLLCSEYASQIRYSRYRVVYSKAGDSISVKMKHIKLSEVYGHMSSPNFLDFIYLIT